MADASISEQIVREAPDIEAYKMGLLTAANNLQAPTLPGYQVAGLTDQQKAAINIGQQGIGAYQPYLTGAGQTMGQGVGMLGNAANLMQGADTRGQFAGGQSALNMAGQSAQNAGQSFNTGNNAANYMSPYMQNVIDIQKREAQRQAGIQGTQQQAQATQSGAFGGSRDAIMRAERERNLGTQMNDIQATGLQNAYQNAQNQFNTEQNAQLQKSQALQGVGQGIGNLAAQQFGIGQQMAQGIGALGTQYGNLGTQQAALGQTAQGLGQNDVNQLYNLGAVQQKQSQAVLDAQRATSMQNAMQPYQHLAFQSDIYKGAPSSQMGVTTAMQPTPSPFQQIAGLGTGLVSGAAAGAKLGLF